MRTCDRQIRRVVVIKSSSWSIDERCDEAAGVFYLSQNKNGNWAAIATCSAHQIFTNGAITITPEEYEVAKVMLV